MDIDQLYTKYFHMHSSSSLWMNPYDVEDTTINHSNSTYSSNQCDADNNKKNQDIFMNVDNGKDEDNDIHMIRTRINVLRNPKEMNVMEKKLNSQCFGTI